MPTGILQSLNAIQRVMDSPLDSATERLSRLVEEVLDIIFEFREFIVVYEREEKSDGKPKPGNREHHNLFDHKLAEILEQGREAEISV